MIHIIYGKNKSGRMEWSWVDPWSACYLCSSLVFVILCHPWFWFSYSYVIATLSFSLFLLCFTVFLSIFLTLTPEPLVSPPPQVQPRIRKFCYLLKKGDCPTLEGTCLLLLSQFKNFHIIFTPRNRHLKHKVYRTWHLKVANISYIM